MICSEEEKTVKKLKKMLNLHNFAVAGCVILIIASLVIIIEPDFSSLFAVEVLAEGNQEKEVNIVQADKKGEEISEEDARRLAKNQFKEIGEEKVNTKKLEVLKIDRQGEEYYYISSTENTVEIKISTGEITRINSVKVNK